MSTKYKQFGDCPSATVKVQERDDILDLKNEIRVNWSCVGEIPVDRASEFHSQLGQALRYARRQQERQMKSALRKAKG